MPIPRASKVVNHLGKHIGRLSEPPKHHTIAFVDIGPIGRPACLDGKISYDHSQSCQYGPCGPLSCSAACCCNKPPPPPRPPCGPGVAVAAPGVAVNVGPTPGPVRTHTRHSLICRRHAKRKASLAIHKGERRGVSPPVISPAGLRCAARLLSCELQDYGFWNSAWRLYPETSFPVSSRLQRPWYRVAADGSSG